MGEASLRRHTFSQIVHQFSSQKVRTWHLRVYRFIIWNFMNTFRWAFVEVYIMILLL